ncbi:hypothetical protein PIB30_033893 [Stylosanthes scabra]|uniref:Uncharacterized protein n=1 Tax=Stylosanthes scabra TaxID=79078 RepID=A0ABU6UC23_9FABA|nr:hypothetical protein [Stylosanthes scabra]
MEDKQTCRVEKTKSKREKKRTWKLEKLRTFENAYNGEKSKKHMREKEKRKLLERVKEMNDRVHYIGQRPPPEFMVCRAKPITSSRSSNLGLTERYPETDFVGWHRSVLAGSPPGRILLLSPLEFLTFQLPYFVSSSTSEE